MTAPTSAIHPATDRADHRHLYRWDAWARHWPTAQAAPVLGFGAAALPTVTVPEHQARFVLAAGWVAHAAWDAVHHHADRVVPRRSAETCAVDLTVATVLLTTAFI